MIEAYQLNYQYIDGFCQ